MSTKAATTKLPRATVLSVGKMANTIKVQTARLEWNDRVRKHFNVKKTHLVHDPASSAREGDIIALRHSVRTPNVRHVVSKIITPFGTPISSRPAVPSAEALEARSEEQQNARTLSQAKRGVPEALDRALADGLMSREEVDEVREAQGRVVPTVGTDRVGGNKSGKVDEEGRRKGQRVRKIVGQGLGNVKGLEEQGRKSVDEVARGKVQGQTGRQVR